MSETYVKMAQRFDADPSVIPDTPLQPVMTTNEHGVVVACRETNSAQLPELQEEFYALTAVLVRDTIDIALAEAEHYPPYGLAPVSRSTHAGPSSFDDLADQMRLTLRRATMPLQRVEEAGTHPAINRLRSLSRIFYAGTGADRYLSVASLLGTGINTAVDGVTQSAMAINRVVNESLPIANQADIATIARNSGRIVNRLAAVNIDHLYASFGVVMTTHGGQEFITKGGVICQGAMELVFNPIDALELRKDHRGKFYVDFDTPLAEIPSPIDEDGQKIGDAPTMLKTLGCPARAKLDSDPTALQKLWQWTVDIAEEANLFKPNC